MSDGKSEVVAWALQLADGSLDLYRCADPPNAADLAIAHEQKQKFVPLVPESLLLDARAEIAVLQEQYDEAGREWLFALKRAERAEALAGGFEGLLRRILVLPEAQHQLSMLRKGIGTETATGVYLEIANSLAAIDAVGGRGER